jgi:hypothetical protein
LESLSFVWSHAPQAPAGALPAEIERGRMTDVSPWNWPCVGLSIEQTPMITWLQAANVPHRPYVDFNEPP